MSMIKVHWNAPAPTKSMMYQWHKRLGGLVRVILVSDKESKARWEYLPRERMSKKQRVRRRREFYARYTPHSELHTPHSK